MLISNHHQETVLLSRLLRHQEDEDKVTVVSSDGDNFRISRFVFSFFSSYFQTDSFDVVLTPISKECLDKILHILKLNGSQQLSEYDLKALDLLGIDPKSVNGLMIKTVLKMEGANPDLKGGGKESEMPKIKTENDDFVEVESCKATSNLLDFETKRIQKTSKWLLQSLQRKTSK